MANYNEHIPALRREAATMPLRFSFRHLDFSSSKFHPSRCSNEYFIRLLTVLQRYSSWRVEDFIYQNNSEHRHVIPFDTSSEPSGFERVPGIDKEQLGYHDGWQIGVCPEDRENQWRAHGILIDDTFFVIWLDQDHQLFPKPPIHAQGC